MTIKRHELKEDIIYLSLWLILFLAPVISLYVHAHANSGFLFHWSEVLSVWKTYIVYFIVFIVHNIFIAPFLIYKRKKMLYFSLVACILIVFQVYQCEKKPEMDDGGPIHRHELMEQGRGHIKENGHGTTPGMHPGDMHPGKEKPGDMRPPMDGKMHRPHPPLFFGELDIISFIIIFLMLGMNLAVKLYFKSENDSKEMVQMEQQSLRQQLEYLKYQINPHFFMNTLNNIHALVDIDPEKAKTTIVELSKMMRYVLYEGNKEFIPLLHDMEFLGNYVRLMRLRFTDKVKISVTTPDKTKDYGIPPLMLITFVENAFKHGVTYQKESFINISTKVENGRLLFACENSKAKERGQEPGGVGLTNVRERLRLIYGSDYTLDIRDANDTYSVNLNIPLKQMKEEEG